MGQILKPIAVIVALVGFNVGLVARDDCYKCCGGGASAYASIGHRACGEEFADCHVTNGPVEFECPGETCNDSYNDVCSENDEGWECDDFGLHWCLGLEV